MTGQLPWKQGEHTSRLRRIRKDAERGMKGKTGPVDKVFFCFGEEGKRSAD